MGYRRFISDALGQPVAVNIVSQGFIKIFAVSLPEGLALIKQIQDMPQIPWRGPGSFAGAVPFDVFII
ncbi:hypothetical protein SDC9_182992 [bioreactor metagenome]|uniref:Uncharacterized protein n=1 Tax=bioreactor metagenome TaxID=1076179 RepID=A0A645HHA7_9ZZZZ